MPPNCRALLEDKLKQEMAARKRAEDEAKRAEELAVERVEALKAEAARLEREAAVSSDEKAELDRERRLLQEVRCDVAVLPHTSAVLPGCCVITYPLTFARHRLAEIGG